MRVIVIIDRIAHSPVIILALQVILCLKSTIGDKVAFRRRRIIGGEEIIGDGAGLCGCIKSDVSIIRRSTDNRIIIGRVRPHEIGGSLVIRRQFDIHFGESGEVLIALSPGSRVGLGILNRRLYCDLTGCLASAAFKELGIKRIGLLGRSIQTFQTEGLRSLNSCILNNQCIHIRTPYLQFSGILLVVKSYYAVHRTGPVRYISICRYSNKRSDLTCARCSFRAILINPHTY